MDFKAEVLDVSENLPVVVDFWAEWCGPCRVLGPIIEELADEADGTWKLVKLNTEDDPELAQEYRIRGIPAVKMFYKGEVVAEFTGALPKGQIEKWLKEHLPDDRLDGLQEIMDSNDLDALQHFMAENPDLAEAKLAWAERVFETRPQEVEALLHELSGDPEYLDAANDLLALLELILWDGSPDAHEKTLHAHKDAQSALKSHDYGQVVEHLIQAIMLQKSYRNELARRVCVALFHRLGEESEVTQKYRRRFNIALY